MKVVLINPPQVFSKAQVAAGVIPPLGLMYLAATLRRAEHTPLIIDSVIEGVEKIYDVSKSLSCRGLDFPAIIAKIPKDTGLICITNHFSFAFPVVRELTKRIKQTYPLLPIAVGGAHPSALPRETVLEDSIDFVCISEGEETLISLVKNLDNREALFKIDGLAFKDEDGIPHVMPKQKYIEDLDRLPFPARDLVPLEKYFRVREAHGPSQRRWTPILSSRGCPFKCTFCTQDLWDRKYRVRSAESVLDEIELCVNEYNIREFHFEDENLTLNKERMHKICKGLIERELNIIWQTPNGIRASVTDEETLTLMKESGCYHITVAPESGSERVLNDIMKKQQDLSKVTAVVRHASKIGLRTAAYFMVGLPGETLDDLKMTVNYGCQLGKTGLDEVLFSNFTPLPGSELFKQLIHDQKIDVDWNDLVSIGDVTKTKSWAEEIPSEVLNAVRFKAYLKFHALKAMYHPMKVLRSIFNVLRRKEELKTERVLITFSKRLFRSQSTC